jgi:integrase
MASCWITKRTTKSGVRHRVLFRVGGADTPHRYGGSFKTLREAKLRVDFIRGELAARRVPDLTTLAEPPAAPTLREMAERWRAGRVDVSETTKVLHRVSLSRVMPILGSKRVDQITTADVTLVVERLHADGKRRETIRKSVTVLAMVLDFAGVTPNPARDRVQVRLPREDAVEMEPPTADHVEAVCWRLTVPYMIGVLLLDATGVRVGELEAARIGDLDEDRRSWLIRSSVAKTRRRRWVEIPPDLYDLLLQRLPAREDRDPDAPLFAGVEADWLRTAIGRACRDAGVPVFSPHSLRHRRISLLHRQGVSWAEIGERMGQKSKLVTADTYTHALIDGREVDRPKLLERASSAVATRTPLRTSSLEIAV